MYKRPERWEDCKREDLSSIPKMISNGFTPIFHSQDKTHKRTTIDNVPHNTVSFERDNIHIWKTSYVDEHVLYHRWRMYIDESRSEMQVFDSIDDILSHLEVTHPAQTQTN